jgi:hypothetical protein
MTVLHDRMVPLFLSAGKFTLSRRTAQRWEGLGFLLSLLADGEAAD